MKTFITITMGLVADCDCPLVVVLLMMSLQHSRSDMIFANDVTAAQ